MTHQTVMDGFIIKGNFVFRQKCTNDLYNLVIDFVLQHTYWGINDAMTAFCIKADFRFAGFAAHRELGFVAVTPRFFHTFGIAYGNAGKTTDTLQMVFDFFGFERKLSFIRKMLQLATAAFCCNRTGGGYPMGGRLQNFQQFPVTEMFFCFDDEDFDDLFRQGAFHKDRIAVNAPNAFAIGTDVCNGHGVGLIFFNRKFHTSPPFL